MWLPLLLLCCWFQVQSVREVYRTNGKRFMFEINMNNGKRKLLVSHHGCPPPYCWGWHPLYKVSNLFQWRYKFTSGVRFLVVNWSRWRSAVCDLELCEVVTVLFWLNQWGKKCVFLYMCVFPCLVHAIEWGLKFGTDWTPPKVYIIS